MRTRVDTLRSLKRYLAQFVPESWDIRLNSEDGTTDRPVLIIEPVGAMLSNQRTVWQVEYTQPVVLYAYPSPGSTAAASQQAAFDIEKTLLSAFNQGGHGGSPRRIPVYSFDGVDPDKPIGGVLPDGPTKEEEEAQAKAIEEAENGAMQARDASSSVNEHPQDAMLWSVTINVRLNWLGAGESRTFEPVEEVRFGDADLT